MKYTITRLDGRFSYRDWFQYYIGFAGRMSNHQGPKHFNDVLKWFFDTYGWSAEIRQYDQIHKWTSISGQLGIKTQPLRIASGILDEPSAHCNPHWSWTNHYPDLRIYVASDQELAFFQLAHKVDQ